MRVSLFSWVLNKRFHCTHIIHTHMHAHTYKYPYTNIIHIHVHIFTYIHIHTHMHKQHMHMHRCMHVNAHAHLHTTVLIPMSQIIEWKCKIHIILCVSNSYTHSYRNTIMHQLGYIYSQIWFTEENKFFIYFKL